MCVCMLSCTCDWSCEEGRQWSGGRLRRVSEAAARKEERKRERGTDGPCNLSRQNNKNERYGKMLCILCCVDGVGGWWRKQVPCQTRLQVRSSL